MELTGFWSIFWLIIEVFLLFSYIILFFMIVQDLFRDTQLGGFAKAVWVVFLIILPVIAALVYLIARGGGIEKRRSQQSAAAQKSIDSYIREVAGANPAHVIAEAHDLLSKGVLTQEEFAQIKRKALQ